MFSVLNQPFDDFEYIIIDGGSNDGSKDVIEEMIKTHPCGKKISFWCSEKDNGIYNAMNKGISHCNGKFIGIMNSGDFYFENERQKGNPGSLIADISSAKSLGFVPSVSLEDGLKRYTEWVMKQI